MTEMEIIDATLRASGWPDAATVLRERWIDAALPFEQAHFLTGFPQPDQRFHFAPDWAALGPDHACMPRLPDHMPSIDETTPESSVSAGHCTGAQFPQYEFHGDGKFADAGKCGPPC